MLHRFLPHGISRWAAALAVGAVACTAGLSTLAVLTSASRAAVGVAGVEARAAKSHFACSGPNSANVPCHFSTPSGNIRCVWTQKPNNVACELLSNSRAYRLRPTGKAGEYVGGVRFRAWTPPRSLHPWSPPKRRLYP